MRTRSGAVTLTILLTAACAPPVEEPSPAADAPSGGGAVGDLEPQLSWPVEMRALGTSTQTPGPDRELPILIPEAAVEIRYDWPRRKMYTAFDPCPPLLTAIAGSDEPCEYYFVGGDVYYVFSDQKMTADPPRPEPSCCVINNFSMLNYRFPEYVQQYTADNRCAGAAPESPCLGDVDGSTLPTPGDGFYLYHSQPVLSAAGHAETWLRPGGFGGITPNKACTDVRYDTVIAFPADIAEIALPELCQPAKDDPMAYQCQDCSGDGCQDLSPVFEVLKQPEVAGCLLCHNTFDDSTYPKPFPCCPDPGTDRTGCPKLPDDASEVQEPVARSW